LFYLAVNFLKESKMAKAKEKSSPKSNKKTGWSIKKIIFRVIAFFFLSSILLTILYRFIPVYYTPLMFSRLVERKLDGKDFKLMRDWESLENISPNLVTAVISSEDQKFLEHNGFDYEAMKKAFDSNKKGKKIRGGSTISQQVAKNVFLWQGRSYLRKGLEAYFTVLIEFIWSKERIMEVYLNVIEMGQGVYGAEAASQYYFHKSAKNLNRSQAAWVAAILPCPLKYDPNHPSGYLLRRHAFIQTQMRYVGKIQFDK
jgi:monofunctional glycosyltransferase